MTAPQVNALFQDYIAAFVANDIDRICALWDYPAVLTWNGRQQVFESKAFRQNAVRLCRFYADQGMVRAEKDLLDLVPLTATVAAARTADRMYRADGSLLAAWQHAYLLSESPRGIRIVVAMPDDETRAWRELGVR